MAEPNKDRKPGIFPINLKADELHMKLGGGVPQGSVVYIEGPEGSGRSVLSQRLAYGFLMNDASVTFVSTEMTIKAFIDQMYSLEYRIAPFLLSNKLSFMPVYPLLGNSMARDDFLDKLVNSPALYERDILIVDSFSSLVNRKLDDNQAMAMMGFMKKITKMNKTVVMTAEAGIPSFEPLRLASDVFLNMNMKTGGGGITREIHVKRFLRARGQVDDTMKYRVEARSGLVIEITDVSG
ncbi:MAG: flagellar accessory protein FlaH [Methanomassiliicoccales archaeon PtaU1.Bin124]|nr:MAG: flagellar accessory protein FlaH [Methanomassiliicoccales archaeon PtaU1.Bin124]